MALFEHPLILLFGTRGDAEVVAPFIEWFGRKHSHGGSSLMIVCVRDLEDTMQKLVEHASIPPSRVRFGVADVGKDAMLNLLPPGGDPNSESLLNTIAMGDSAKSVLKALLQQAGDLAADGSGASVVVSNAWQAGVSAAFLLQTECLLLNPYPIMLPDAFPDETASQLDEREARELSKVNWTSDSGFSINMITFYAQTLNYIPAARHTQAKTLLVPVIRESVEHLKDRWPHRPWPDVHESGLVRDGEFERLSTAVLEAFTVNYWNRALLEPADDIVVDVTGADGGNELNYFVNRSIKNRTSTNASQSPTFAEQWASVVGGGGVRVGVFVSFGSMIVVSTAMRDRILDLIRSAGEALPADGSSVVMVHAVGSMWTPFETARRRLEPVRVEFEMEQLRGMRNVVVWDKPFNHLDLAAVLAPEPIFVHHGGVGTLTTAAQLGCYNVIVAMLADQPYWGDRVERVLQTGRSIWSGDLERMASGDEVREFWTGVLEHQAASRERVHNMQARILSGSDERREVGEWDTVMKRIERASRDSPALPFRNGKLPELIFSNTSLTYVVDHSNAIVAVVAVVAAVVVLGAVFAIYVYRRRTQSTKRE